MIISVAYNEDEVNWNHINIDYDQNDPKDVFFGFKYVIEISKPKITDEFCSTIDEMFRARFMYPNKELGQHTILGYRYFGNDEKHYAATNCYDDAIIIALEYK